MMSPWQGIVLDEQKKTCTYMQKHQYGNQTSASVFIDMTMSPWQGYFWQGIVLAGPSHNFN